LACVSSSSSRRKGHSRLTKRPALLFALQGNQGRILLAVAHHFVDGGNRQV
jgi:hypothetical protein